jgi:hypothetical protein
MYNLLFALATLSKHNMLMLGALKKLAGSFSRQLLCAQLPDMDSVHLRAGMFQIITLFIIGHCGIGTPFPFLEAKTPIATGHPKFESARK